MKRTAAALRRAALSVAHAVGLEGAFLLAGTALLSTGAGFIAPAGPWIVSGSVFLLAGIALAVPPRRP